MTAATNFVRQPNFSDETAGGDAQCDSLWTPDRSSTIQRGASFLNERRSSDGGRNGAASREERRA
jgi:hypothetical protein